MEGSTRYSVIFSYSEKLEKKHYDVHIEVEIDDVDIEVKMDEHTRSRVLIRDDLVDYSTLDENASTSLACL